MPSEQRNAENANLQDYDQRTVNQKDNLFLFLFFHFNKNQSEISFYFKSGKINLEGDS